MANNSITHNRNYAPFVDDEFPAANGNILPGHELELDANTDVLRNSGESSPGRGMVADLSKSNPDLGRDDTYPSGERVSVVYVPVGGEVTLRLAAGGDLGTASRADVDTTDVLESVGDGAVAAIDDGSDVEGALYQPLEDVDNSGAAAGEQTTIEAVRGA